MLVGAPDDDTAAGANAGSAHVYLFGVLSDITATVDHVAMLYSQAVLDALQADALIANLEAVVASRISRPDRPRGSMWYRSATQTLRFGKQKRGYVIPSLEVMDATGKTVLMIIDPIG